MPSPIVSQKLRALMKEHAPDLGAAATALLREVLATLEVPSASDLTAVAVAEAVAEALVAVAAVPHDAALALACHMTSTEDAWERRRGQRPPRPTADALARHGRELLKVSVVFARDAGATWQRRVEVWIGQERTLRRTTEAAIPHDDLPDEVRAAYATERRDRFAFDLDLRRS